MLKKKWTLVPANISTFTVCHVKAMLQKYECAQKRDSFSQFTYVGRTSLFGNIQKLWGSNFIQTFSVKLRNFIGLQFYLPSISSKDTGILTRFYHQELSLNLTFTPPNRLSAGAWSECYMDRGKWTASQQHRYFCCRGNWSWSNHACDTRRYRSRVGGHKCESAGREAVAIGKFVQT